MNCFVCGVPVLFLCNIVPMGIVFQVKYNEALVRIFAVWQRRKELTRVNAFHSQSIDSFFQQGLRLLPSTAPVTSEELEQAVHVWAKFVSTWTYGALLFFTCGVWSLATALFFLVVFILLLLELRRQKLEHSTGTFAAAGMAVDPVWNETTQDNMATGTLVVTSRSMMHQDKLNAAGFFPPFRPAPSVFTASTSALFGKCLRNICASSLLAIGALALTACVSSTVLQCNQWTLTDELESQICLYTGFISPKAIASPDRRYFMLGHLTTQILTSVALVLGGAAVTHEIITQSLQPVLSAWVYKSSASATRSARAQAQRRSQGQPGFKVASQSIFASAARMPNTVKSHIERASASIFEINSKIPRQRLYSSTDSREAVASLGLQEQGEAQNDAARDPTVQARVRRAKSLPMNLREVSHGTHDSSLDAASHDTLQRSTVDAQILSYDEVRRLRGIPKPAQPIRVHFIREVQTTYEDVRPPPRAGRLQQPYVPSWRYPPNHIHHTPSYQLTHEQHLYN